MDKSLEIADIIVAFIKGEVTSDEMLVLDEWLEEAEDNKRLFVSLLEDSAFVQRLHEGQQLSDAEKAFERVRERKHKSTRLRRLRMITVAASVAVFLLVGGIWMYQSKIPGTEVIVQQNYISTGKSKAFLTLASGERITLERQDTLLCSDVVNIRVQEKGEVSYEMKDSATPLNMVYNTMEIPRGAEFQLTLSDGTKVWLNAGSKLVYPVNFIGKERRVILRGEAYFDVSHQEEFPFVVETSCSDVTVLGTEFCIRDYEGETNLTTLVKGRVAVKDPQGMSYVLKPGQQVNIDKDGSRVQDVETIYFTSWKDGYFIFDQATLGEIMTELSKWYDFDCFFVNASTANLRLTARLKKYDDIGVILDILSRTGDIHFSQKGRAITIGTTAI